MIICRKISQQDWESNLTHHPVCITLLQSLYQWLLAIFSQYQFKALSFKISVTKCFFLQSLSMSQNACFLLLLRFKSVSQSASSQYHFKSVSQSAFFLNHYHLKSVSQSALFYCHYHLKSVSQNACFLQSLPLDFYLFAISVTKSLSCKVAITVFWRTFGSLAQFASFIDETCIMHWNDCRLET